MKRKLAIGITCYPSVGGSGILACALGEELARRGHDVHFISYERPFRLPPDGPGLHFHEVGINDYDLFKYPDYTLPLSVRLAEVSRSHQLDILHVHYAVPHATAAILARSMLPLDERPALITTLHGTDTTLLGRDPGYRPAIHHALQCSDAVTTVSEYLSAQTRQVLGFTGAIEVIHNFYTPRPPSRTREEMRNKLGLGDEVVIFHSSNLRPLKRIDLLLETVARLRPKTTFKLLILAGGSFRGFENDVQRLGLQNQVIVRENVSEIEDYLQIGDVGFFTSEVESFCLSILEAMSFACPCVARAVGGIPEVVESYRNGILVPPDDTEGLFRALETLVDRAEIRKELGKSARQCALERFSAGAIVPRYEALYESVTDRCVRARSEA